MGTDGAPCVRFKTVRGHPESHGTRPNDGFVFESNGLRGLIPLEELALGYKGPCDTMFEDGVSRSGGHSRALMGAAEESMGYTIARDCKVQPTHDT